MLSVTPSQLASISSVPPSNASATFYAHRASLRALIKITFYAPKMSQEFSLHGSLPDSKISHQWPLQAAYIKPFF